MVFVEQIPLTNKWGIYQTIPSWSSVSGVLSLGVYLTTNAEYDTRAEAIEAMERMKEDKDG
jgi:hypothetical protein